MALTLGHKPLTCPSLVAAVALGTHFTFFSAPSLSPASEHRAARSAQHLAQVELCPQDKAPFCLSAGCSSEPHTAG